MLRELDAAERAAGIGSVGTSEGEFLELTQELLPDILFLIWIRGQIQRLSFTRPNPTLTEDPLFELACGLDWLVLIFDLPHTPKRSDVEEFARGALDDFFRRQRRRQPKSRAYVLGARSSIPVSSVAAAAEHLVAPGWREHYRTLVQLAALAGDLV